jgi:uncharacterized protein
MMKTLKIKELKNFWDKAMGMLMLEKPEAIFFKTRWGIHTFGVKWPIDVAVLDQNERVVKMVWGLKPNRIWLWNPIYNSVVELPAGDLKRLKVKIGEVLSIYSGYSHIVSS